MKSLIILIAVFVLVSCSTPTIGQSFKFMPQKIELSDTTLKDAITKYLASVLNREIMIIARESLSDSVKYYISAINSQYNLSKNIPSAYTQVGNKYIFLYTGLENIAIIGDAEKNRFVSQFRSSLRNDILADGKTRDPKSIGSYDPIQCLIVVVNGKKVYEDFKRGFGPRGIPYIK